MKTTEEMLDEIERMTPEERWRSIAQKLAKCGATNIKTGKIVTEEEVYNSFAKKWEEDA
jgi:hypothetical protein